jgi:hypothetical protein
VHRALRISEGPKLSLIMGCSGSSEMAAFSNVFGDVGLTDSEITGGCCAEGSLEPMMPSEDVGFVMDRVMIAVRRGSSLLLFWPSILSTSPSIGVVMKEYWRGCFSCCSHCSLRRGACF